MASGEPNVIWTTMGRSTSRKTEMATQRSTGEEGLTTTLAIEGGVGSTVVTMKLELALGGTRKRTIAEPVATRRRRTEDEHENAQ